LGLPASTMRTFSFSRRSRHVFAAHLFVIQTDGHRYFNRFVFAVVVDTGDQPALIVAIEARLIEQNAIDTDVGWIFYPKVHGLRLHITTYDTFPAGTVPPVPLKIGDDDQFLAFRTKLAEQPVGHAEGFVVASRLIRRLQRIDQRAQRALVRRRLRQHRSILVELDNRHAIAGTQAIDPPARFSLQPVEVVAVSHAIRGIEHQDDAAIRIRVCRRLCTLREIRSGKRTHEHGENQKAKRHQQQVLDLLLPDRPLRHFQQKHQRAERNDFRFLTANEVNQHRYRQRD
jgi:hypothetical protein